MPNKGESKTVNVTPIKLEGPRTFGDNGKAWTLVVQESSFDSYEIYNQEGADALTKVLGTTVEITVEFSNQFQGMDKWKVTKVPGWERGAGGQGRGKQFDPRSNFAIAALNAGVASTNVGVDGVEQALVFADAYFEWLLKANAQAAPAPAASTNGEVAPADAPLTPSGEPRILDAQIERILELGRQLGMDARDTKLLLRKDYDPNQWAWQALTFVQGRKGIMFLEKKVEELGLTEGALG